MAFGQIRDGLKVRLDTIDGLRVHDTVPDSVAPPAAIIFPGDPVVSYDDTFEGGERYRLSVRVMVAKSDMRTAQDKLDAYMAGTGTGSIRAAVDADVTLGGAASDTRVVQAGNYGEYAVGEIGYLGVEFTVEVLA